ncbi:hypothetical protein L798_02509 [Zootermopsis nevadensis]|uniref:Uncharacterized protein n=1 Tax=Zootermopsis nevadensis TaxID=136037 RepID=A0A067REU8_ZOONE|nr:hypothetical protein L798_02509 [Zootermopsis nevadensis]
MHLQLLQNSSNPAKYWVIYSQLTVLCEIPTSCAVFVSCTITMPCDFVNSPDNFCHVCFKKVYFNSRHKKGLLIALLMLCIRPGQELGSTHMLHYLFIKTQRMGES